MKEKITLLFSGTIADTTGAFTAIDLAGRLHHNDHRIHLKIIGYAAQDSVRNRIRDTIRDKSFIQVIGLDRLVEHSRILEEIGNSDFGIIAYPPNPSTHTAFPTKLYEYLGYQLPILLINHDQWSDYCKQYQAAITFDPADTSTTELLNKMLTQQFYIRYPEDVFWGTEETELKRVLASLAEK